MPRPVLALACLVCSLLSVSSLATNAVPACPPGRLQPQRPFPFIDVDCKLEVRYLGSYHPDGKFRPLGLLDALHDPVAIDNATLRPPEVPPAWNLHAREKSIRNFGPSAHGKEALHGHSLLASWRDDLVTLAYGREKAFLQPRYVTTDPLGRLIVGDPAASAVHVIGDDQPFRILAGPDLRLRSIAGLAADQDSNIYIGDADAELVVVFDRYGHWLRDIGRYNANEGMFHQLSGIAIDRARRRLYVTDQSQNTLLILDLDGRLLRRVGGRRHEQGIDFDRPIAVSTRQDLVYVADSDGTQIQVLDPDGKLVRTLATGLGRKPRTQISLDIDSEQNVYIATQDDSSVRILRASGEIMASIGTPGSGRGEFGVASAIWIDAKNQLYVSETGNRRVEVFAISDADTPKFER